MEIIFLFLIRLKKKTERVLGLFTETAKTKYDGWGVVRNKKQIMKYILEVCPSFGSDYRRSTRIFLSFSLF